MNAILLALTLVAPQQDFDKEVFVRKFDKAMSLTEATRLLLDSCYEYGKKPIESISSGYTSLISVFGDSLPLRKAEAIKDRGLRFFEIIDERTRINVITLGDVREVVFGNDYPKQLLSLEAHLVGIREYVESSEADRVVEVRFPTNPGELHNWFLFFNLTEDRKWRLELICPQIVSLAPASRRSFL